MPLRNDHGLQIEDIRWQGLPAWRPRKPKVNIAPESTKGGKYSELIPTWTFEIPTGGMIGNIFNQAEDGEEMVGIPWGDFEYNSADDLMYEDYDNLYTEKCKLCSKLGVEYAERTGLRLKLHMKNTYVVFSCTLALAISEF